MPADAYEAGLKEVASGHHVVEDITGLQQYLEAFFEHIFYRLFKLARMLDRAWQRHSAMQSQRFINEDERKASLLEQSLIRTSHRISMLNSPDSQFSNERMSLLRQVLNLEDQRTVSMLHHGMVQKIQEVYKDLSDAMVQITVNEKEMSIQIKTPLNQSFEPSEEHLGLSQLLQQDIESAIRVHELLSRLSRELRSYFQTEPNKTQEIEQLSRRVNSEMERLRAFQKLTEENLDGLAASGTSEMSDAFTFALQYMKQMLGE